MDLYHIWCDLKPGERDVEFIDCLPVREIDHFALRERPLLAVEDSHVAAFFNANAVAARGQ